MHPARSSRTPYSLPCADLRAKSTASQQKRVCPSAAPAQLAGTLESWPQAHSCSSSRVKPAVDHDQHMRDGDDLFRSEPVRASEIRSEAARSPSEFSGSFAVYSLYVLLLLGGPAVLLTAASCRLVLPSFQGWPRLIRLGFPLCHSVLRSFRPSALSRLACTDSSPARTSRATKPGCAEMRLLHG